MASHKARSRPGPRAENDHSGPESAEYPSAPDGPVDARRQRHRRMVGAAEGQAQITDVRPITVAHLVPIEDPLDVLGQMRPDARRGVHRHGSRGETRTPSAPR